MLAIYTDFNAVAIRLFREDKSSSVVGGDHRIASMAERVAARAKAGSRSRPWSTLSGNVTFEKPLTRAWLTSRSASSRSANGLGQITFLCVGEKGRTICMASHPTEGHVYPLSNSSFDLPFKRISVATVTDATGKVGSCRSKPATKSVCTPKIKHSGG